MKGVIYAFIGIMILAVIGGFFTYITLGQERGSTASIIVTATPSYVTPGDGVDGDGVGDTLRVLKIIIYEGMTFFQSKISSSGVLLEPLVITNPTVPFTLEVSLGTKVLTGEGKVPDEITIRKVDEPPSPPADFKIVGSAYEFAPSRITFDPPARLTFNFDLKQLPERTEYVVLARYIPETGWEELESKTKSIAGELSSVTTHISRFTMFSILAKIIPLPPAFAVGSLVISPSQATIGEKVTIALEVANTGGRTGSYRLQLRIDGTVRAARDITLNPGESKPVSFELTDLSLGRHQVEVNGLTAELTVVPLPVAPAKPFNWWLIGAIIAAAVLAAALTYFFIKQRKSGGY